MQPHILVPFDFGLPSEHALAWAGDLQRNVGGLLIHVIHVLSPSPLIGTERMAATLCEEEINDTHEALKRAVLRRGIAATTEIIVAPSVAEAILDSAKRLNADLIVIGTHGRSGLRRPVLGSVAETVIRGARCPVLTVRGAPAYEQPARAA
jgi:nucleotide-binding universal stress UspA family protein